MRRMYSKNQLINLIEEHSAETAVASVNGITSEVTLKASDIKANNAATIQSNLERIDERIDGLDSGKLDKVTTTSTYARLYGITTGGQQNAYSISRDGHPADTIVQRGSDGVINIGTPTANNHATTKAYVDDKVGSNILREISITLDTDHDTWTLPDGITFARVKLSEEISNIAGIAQWNDIYSGGIARKGYLKYLTEPNHQAVAFHNYLNEGDYSGLDAYIEYDPTTSNIHLFAQGP